jgi:uncharacterized protein YqjF (DUF2071 family)
MRTVFRHCVLANFAIRPDALAARLPAPLRPDVHDGTAFLSIVIAEMERMRPAFLPAALGITYTQVVYRAVVSCRGERGVHFLRSDADHRSWRWPATRSPLPFPPLRRQWSSARTRSAFPTVPARRCRRSDRRRLHDLAAGGTADARFVPLRDAQASAAVLTELYVAIRGAASRRSDRRTHVRIRRNDWRSLVVPDRIASYQAMESTSCSDLARRGLTPASSTSSG